MHLIISLLLLLALPAIAQIEAPGIPYDYEQNPNHIHWKKIDTDHFEIIFPQEISIEAQRVAHLLEQAYPLVARSLEVNPPKIPLVLQNQSTVSNGFVTLAPRRSEWYVTPTIDPQLGNTEWLKTLALHEFRHVVQFHKTRRGFNIYLELWLGEIGQALGLALTLPPWFLEGDAVGIETALTEGGRGRLPLFERDLRTLLLSGKEFNFDKAHMRSYEDYVPNHYVYGYFLTTQLRNENGELFLSQLADQSAETSWNPLSFYNTTDSLVKGNFEDFYQRTMRHLIREWKERADKLTPTPYEIKNIGKRFGWTNYYYPQVTKDNKTLALKRGLSFINQFVLLNGKEEETLFYPGVLANEYNYKLRSERLAYLELDIDPRWGNRDYSRLKVYDLNQREFILDIKKTKWRLGVLNSAGKKVLLIKWDESQDQRVQVINLKQKILHDIDVPKTEVITSVDWLNDEEVALVIKHRDDSKSVVSLNLLDKTMTTLMDRSQINLGFLTVENGHILVESPASGIDNIFLLENKGLRQITSALFGAYAPTIHDGRLIYNDYTVHGMNVVKKELAWEEAQESKDSFYPFYEKFARFEGKSALAHELSAEKDFEIQDYSQTAHAINLHSWFFIAPPLSNTMTLVGYSRDILNKFTLSAGAEYNLSEQRANGFVSLAWTHLFPIFDLRAAYGGRRTEDSSWEEGTFEAGMQIPWRKLVGRMNSSFTFRAFAKLIKVTGREHGDSSDINDGALYSPGAEIEYSYLSRLSHRDLLPPWGFSIFTHLEEGKDITGSSQRGSLFTADSRVYFPGLWHHHSFYHQLAYERQRSDSYEYASFISSPRGTRNVSLEEFTKYSANYSLPLFYPDWNWSRYFYLKRVALNGFYDELRGNLGSSHYDASSAGWELLFETFIARLLLPVTFGVRGSYVFEGLERSDNYEVFLASGLGTF